MARKIIENMPQRGDEPRSVGGSRCTYEVTPGRPGVTVRQVKGATRLWTIAPDDAVWVALAAGGHAPAPGWAPGSIVRLIPPPSADAGHAASLAASLRAAGAVVRVLPRARAATVPAASVKRGGARAGARGVVLRLVAEAATGDRAALLACVEETMSEVGL